MKRRTFLRLSAFGPAMLALHGLPGAGVTAAAGAAQAPGAESVLDPGERELLLAIVERMVDTGLPDAPNPREPGVLAAIEGALAQLDVAVVDQLRWALRLVDWWPALGELRWRRFQSLSPEEQDASLEGWRTSSLAPRRLVFYALRNLAMLGYWSQDATWRLIGYGGPWIRRSSA